MIHKFTFIKQKQNKRQPSKGEKTVNSFATNQYQIIPENGNKKLMAFIQKDKRGIKQDINGDALKQTGNKNKENMELKLKLNVTVQSKLTFS